MELNDPTVVVRDLSKTYRVRTTQGSRIAALNPFRREKVEAVKGATFVAQKGEAIGILGRNGSGKSTLLRMIAGSEKPTNGEIYVSEKPSLLGVSAALIPGLTGLQNIKLGLLAMGRSQTEAKDMVPEIGRISQLSDALHRPMNTYSSGMQARLTFAIATSLEPEILMIDEALGTGDATFAEIANRRMEELSSSAGTIFVVSHSAATLRKTCRRGIWIHDGELVADGDLFEISSQYAIWGELITNGDLSGAEQVIAENKAEYQCVNVVLKSEAERFFAGGSSLGLIDGI